MHYFFSDLLLTCLSGALPGPAIYFRSKVIMGVMTAYGHRATTVVALLHENGITPAAPGRLLHCWEWVAGRWKMVSYAFVKFCEVVKYAKYVCIYIYVRTLCMYLYIYIHDIYFGQKGILCWKMPKQQCG